MAAIVNEPLSRHALAFVLAGGRGSRLLELTDRRAKPAVYFGGKSRIIDFALSNAMNSGIRRIARRNPIQGAQPDPASANGLELLSSGAQREFRYPAREPARLRDATGTSERLTPFIRTSISSSRYDAKFIVLLAGDHIYKMDYELHAAAARRAARRRHHRLPRGAARGSPAASASCTSTTMASILSFLEKPADPPPMPGKPDKSLASMGIYVFEIEIPVRRAAARRRTTRIRAMISARTSFPTSSRTGGRSRINSPPPASGPTTIRRAYWRDVGTVDAYWAANIDLTDVLPELDLYDRAWPIWTHAEITPPAKFVHDEDGRRGQAVTSLVSGGCIISGAALRRSLLFTGVHVHSYGKHGKCRRPALRRCGPACAV